MLEVGSLVDGKYRILRVVGKGGMSVVYQAVNEKANKIWAIKEVRKDGVQNYEVVKQNLIVETELLKRFNHPNLPSIIDVIDGDGSFLIVMDYIEGRSLQDLLDTEDDQRQQNGYRRERTLSDHRIDDPSGKGIADAAYNNALIFDAHTAQENHEGKTCQILADNGHQTIADIQIFIWKRDADIRQRIEQLPVKENETVITKTDIPGPSVKSFPCDHRLDHPFDVGVDRILLADTVDIPVCILQECSAEQQEHEKYAYCSDRKGYRIDQQLFPEFLLCFNCRISCFVIRHYSKFFL